MANYVLITACNTKVEIWRSGVGWTTIPISMPAGGYVVCVDGRIDDIWVGGKWSYSPPYDDPWVAHWNGSTWTWTFITDQPSSPGNCIVGALHYVASDEVYCIANYYGGSATAKLYRWNGSVWVNLGTTQTYGIVGRIWKEGVRVFYAGDKYSVYDRYYRWDGTLYNDSDGDSSSNCVALHGLSPHIYTYKINGKLRVKEFGGAFSQIGANPYAPTGAPCIQATDSYIWTSYYSYADYRSHVVRRDKVTGANTSDSNTGADASSMLVVLGDGEYVFVPGGTGLYRRIDWTGSWVFVNRTIRPLAISGYTDVQPPVLQNQNPAPSSTGNRGDGPVYLEVTDPDGDLVASTVEITIQGEVAWSSGAAGDGWTGVRSTVANGFGYTLTRDTSLPAQETITVHVYAEDAGALVLDESYTFDTSSFLDSVSPEMIDSRGGASMEAAGLFTAAALAIHLGPLGTTDDPPCYRGQGLGYSSVSPDGLGLSLVSPPAPKGSNTLTIVDGAETLQLPVTVLERNWPGALHELRRNFAPWKALGPRRLDSEDQE